MSLYKVTEDHTVRSEAAAAKLIEEAKADKTFTLLKSSTVYKTVKEKKEIVDEYWITTLVKQFTDPKEPDCNVTVKYTIDQGYFPDPISCDDEEEEYDEQHYSSYAY